MLRLILCWLAGLTCLPLLAQAGVDCPGSPAAPEVKQGVRAFKNGQYAEAVVHFQAAVTLDSNCTLARFYLGTAYMQRYIPGADTPDNLQMASSALEQFEAVLDRDPEHRAALESMASLYFNMQKLDAARAWYQRLILVDPENQQAYYTLGVIAWTQVRKSDEAARGELEMKPEDPGPLKPGAVQARFRAMNLPILQEGLDDLDRALEIDPEYDDAMAYMNLLLRLKAEAEDSEEEYQADIAKADAWFQKTLDTRKRQEGRH